MTTQELKESVGDNWHQVENYMAQEVGIAIIAAMEPVKLQLEELTTTREELTALQAKVAATTAAVKLAFDADDIPAMLAIAADFVTPESEKERLADIAQAVEFETQAAELRAKHP